MRICSFCDFLALLIAVWINIAYEKMTGMVPQKDGCQFVSMIAMKDGAQFKGWFVPKEEEADLKMQIKEAIFDAALQNADTVYVLSDIPGEEEWQWGWVTVHDGNGEDHKEWVLQGVCSYAPLPTTSTSSFFAYFSRAWSYLTKDKILLFIVWSIIIGIPMVVILYRRDSWKWDGEHLSNVLYGALGGIVVGGTTGAVGGVVGGGMVGIMDGLMQGMLAGVQARCVSAGVFGGAMGGLIGGLMGGISGYAQK